ncbi:galactose-1-phosphate uridylyltransferase [bacterium]|nr:galactose-1-phosphate uridylyltransferase [bacterium]
MSELRYNVATRDWVVVAPERARRPEDFHAGRPITTADRPAHRADCPFCPGSEDHTPGETLRFCDAQGNWMVRSFPNRYPALTPESQEGRPKGNLFRRRRFGSGTHEVVAESPLHNTTLGLQSPAEIEQVLRAWRQRSQDLFHRPELEHLVVFKNHGLSAGCSQEHPHSQIIGLPVLPSSVRRRFDDAARFYQKNQGCVFCEMLRVEQEEAARVVVETYGFLAFVPFASDSPFSVWILPKRHSHCFALAETTEIRELAGVLKQVLARLYLALKDPDYNLIVHSANPPGPGSHFFHWYLSIVPRLSRMAGFELGTGMYIRSSPPEADAAYLRQVNLEALEGPKS